ncbi:hypothetical protein QMZ92_31490 [Streptomyces sp. HNM0645]|uniref:hypothetical protein n=1 Tax=Streptomyces sp. HNM0645 TaxID=2782343 RepID=UPI0024B63923|nr:hypothetical protein [Streptomyces sp. HNM0645]MDI9888753.1 hypothetical protein [Streptomyces sp. HNM0645]
MLTYKEVTTTKFGHLTTAADKWDEVAREFKKVETSYGDSVQKITMGPDWTGVTVSTAYTNFAATRYEYAAAQTQAKAIAKLLRDAHEQFTELKGRLDSIIKAAQEDHMLIDENGVATRDPKSISRMEQNELSHVPEAQAAKRKREEAWTKRIKDAVQAFDDADGGVKIALEGVVKDEGYGGNDETAGVGFNAKAQGDIEEYEARNATDIATRINSGEQVSAADVAELNRTLRDNNNPAFAHRTEFGQTFLNRLGAEGTITLANKLNDQAHSDNKNKGVYGEANHSLANTLATATRVPDFKDADGKKLVYGTPAYKDEFAKWSQTDEAKFYNDFRIDLQKAGVEKYDLDVAGDKIAIGRGHDQEIRGYQGLVTLMQQGSGYSPQFLGDLTDDMIAAEGKDKDIWDLHGKFEGKDDGWFANDPVDGALRVMSRDPEAATGYLDPAADGDKDRLKYLLKDRDWDIVNTTDWRVNIEVTGKDASDVDVRSGLGLALEAGTTGQAPGTPAELGRHSDAQARIMHDTVNLLDYGVAEGKQGDEKRLGRADELLKSDGFANMRDPLARAFAAYSPDVVDIIAGEGPGGRTGKGDELADGDESQIQNSRGSLLRLMRGVSDVPDGSTEAKNFDLIYQAQQGYMAEQLADGDFSNPKTLENRAQRIGEVFGTITAVGGDLDLGQRDAANSEAGDKRFYGYHIGGGAITGIPVIGDIAQRSVDISLNQWMTAVQAENGMLAREKLSAQNDAAHDALDKFFAEWNTNTHTTDSESLKVVQNEARQSYNGSREIAFDALRERK